MVLDTYIVSHIKLEVLRATFRLMDRPSKIYQMSPLVLYINSIKNKNRIDEIIKNGIFSEIEVEDLLDYSKLFLESIYEQGFSIKKRKSNFLYSLYLFDIKEPEKLSKIKIILQYEGLDHLLNAEKLPQDLQIVGSQLSAPEFFRLAYHQFLNSSLVYLKSMNYPFDRFYIDKINIDGQTGLNMKAVDVYFGQLNEWIYPSEKTPLNTFFSDEQVKNWKSIDKKKISYEHVFENMGKLGIQSTVWFKKIRQIFADLSSNHRYFVLRTDRENNLHDLEVIQKEFFDILEKELDKIYLSCRNIREDKNSFKTL